MAQHKLIRDWLEQILNRRYGLVTRGLGMVLGSLAGVIACFWIGLVVTYEAEPFAYAIELSFGGLVVGALLGLLAGSLSRRLMLPVLKRRIYENLANRGLLVKLLDDYDNTLLRPRPASCLRFLAKPAKNRALGKAVERMTELAENYTSICRNEVGIKPWPRWLEY